jgi:two-component system, OmpR family, KDP operon response regulator KdpE
MTRVLVVDDEPQLLRTLALNLRARDYDVITASTAAEGIDHVFGLPPDVVILDLGLPDRDGLEVIREVHEREPTLPIVVLSARASSQEKVTALDLGAVDYITKPFDMNELVARLRAAARRSSRDSAAQVVSIGGHEIDPTTRAARNADGSPLHLTPTEWRILDELLRHPGRLISGQDLLLAIRRDPEHTENSYLRIYMAQLRRKLEPVPSQPRYLLTEPGMGYRFHPDG